MNPTSQKSSDSGAPPKSPSSAKDLTSRLFVQPGVAHAKPLSIGSALLGRNPLSATSPSQTSPKGGLVSSVGPTLKYPHETLSAGGHKLPKLAHDKEPGSFVVENSLQTAEPLPPIKKSGSSQIGVRATSISFDHDEDLDEFLERLTNSKTKNAFGFVYMVARLPRAHPHHNPYDLIIVDYSRIDREDYYTFSKEGVTHYFRGVGEFTALLQWCRERQIYKKMMKIRFFTNYRVWKSYTAWQKGVRKNKVDHARRFLAKNLFHLDSYLQKPLLELRTACLDMANTPIIKLADNITYELGPFSSEQRSWIENGLFPKLQSFQKQARDILDKACNDSLSSPTLFVSSPVDETNAGGNTKNGSGETAPVKRLMYTEKAARRNAAKRLRRFVQLSDYIIIGGIHQMALSSSKRFLAKVFDTCADSDVLCDTHRIAPSIFLKYVDSSEEIMMKKQKAEMDAILNAENKPQERQPLFRVELILLDKEGRLQYTPTLSDYTSRVDSIFHSFIEKVKQFSLISGSLSYLYDIENHEVPDTSNGPNLPSILLDDEEFHVALAYLKGLFSGLFKMSENYAKEYYKFASMFMENLSTDFSWLQAPAMEDMDRALKFFESSLKKFSQQQKDVEAIPVSVPLKNFVIDLHRLKNTLAPNPEKCFSQLAKMLPVLARSLDEKLLDQLNETINVLGSSPDSVDELVVYLEHLNRVKERMPAIEKHFEFVHFAYDLIEKYEIPIPPTDLAFYQTLDPTLQRMKEILEQAEESRSDRTTKLASELDRSHYELASKITQLRNRAQDPSVLDPNSKPQDVLRFVDDLATDLEKISVIAKSYVDYQQRFGLQVTQNGDLEDTRTEILLKRTLWKSTMEWTSITDAWKTRPFDTINMEEMNGVLQNYSRNIYQLEKGLPPNDAVPKLKKSIDEYRAIYPCIVDMRNPSFKSRHWDRIQETTGRVIIRDDNLTLQRLFEMRIFDFKEAIALVSVQASSEATLEEMLSKVTRAWTTTELTVLPYRDYKDVYILGGVDEIQALLEDSQVTIATIRGSRHIGPIKSEVERWDKQLTLFAQTLDAWLTCQRNWLYLESVFNSADIQRQLPEEAKMFSQVDRSWKDTMRKVVRNPNALKAATTSGLLETMQQNNHLLEKVQKCLEDYLESKRLLFPRFYFLSNDELLDILAQTRKPQAVQPHLSKCFDAIKSLEFTSEPRSIDILAMISPEGERFPFLKTLKARGNVEVWLNQVEEAMFAAVKRAIKIGITEFTQDDFQKWLLSQPGQVVLAVTQILWCNEVTECLRSGKPIDALKAFHGKCSANLTKLAAMVRGDLTPLQRSVMSALITLEVHSRDVVQELITTNTSAAFDFEWTKQLRMYFDMESEELLVKMTDTSFHYGNEYLGCSSRLVITPLTDRCYMTLTSAMALNMGGSPLGPAGTGKTETVKDLAKALARQCIVFNCSDTLDYKMMGKMFAGLAQSGAWICFDEFNRVDVSVLSVIGQQLLAIKNAKDSFASKFILDGREIRLVPTCSAFVTMNPGYAGRSELPDNLKRLFMPIAMMIPDYALITEIILYSEGFEAAHKLAGKVVNLYKLCNEQLSRQDHYDFGMRAVKSVLVMAGKLKRIESSLNEDLVLIRSLRDSNLPKFIAEDIPLFRGILQDLFPGVSVPNHDVGDLQKSIRQVIEEKGLTQVSAFSERVVQLYDTMRVRHGIMLVGPTGGAKTTCYDVLAASLTKLRESNHANADFQKVRTTVINPKSITISELYGEYNLTTMEWKDGLIGSVVRAQATDETLDEKWIVFDGPVDALWIENMNSVLDDNKLLCLANGERIRMKDRMHMIFEVADLAVASPATVSRCGMVYMDPNNVGWKPYYKSWLRKFGSKVDVTLVKLLDAFGDEYIEKGLKFVRKNLKESIPTVNLSLVTTLCRLLTSFLLRKDIDWNRSADENKLTLSLVFIFCYVWSIGGNITEASHDAFDTFARQLFSKMEIPIPTGYSLFGYYIDTKSRRLVPWEDSVPSFRFTPGPSISQTIVPTADTVKYSYLLNNMLDHGFPILFNGPTGVGKSVIIQSVLQERSKAKQLYPISVNFSSQTSALSTQQSIESRLEKRRRNLLAAPGDLQTVVFVDDLNMPKPDTFGAQPPAELLRQMFENQGYYDREKLFWKQIQKVSLVGACGPSEGGRNGVTPRLLRHFSTFHIQKPSDLSLARIFRPIVEGFYKNFAVDIRSSTEAIVNSAIEIYTRMVMEVLPTPAKAHYTFNLRDLSKVFQGLLQVKASSMSYKNDLVKLFCHENARVFHDRLINNEDRAFFNQMLTDVVNRNFNVQLTPESMVEAPPLFADFMKKGAPLDERSYVEIQDNKQLNSLLEDYLEEFNLSMNKEMRLIFFKDAKHHLVRISRIIRQRRGNCLLVGIGGTGKQSLTKLVAYMSDYRCYQLEQTRNYGLNEWREDIRNLYRISGVENKNVVFLISDAQIKMESFLEDINSILNSGEITNLFEAEERERILSQLRPEAKEKGLGEERDAVYQYFINRVRDNLHIVFATSPVGDTFRNRCRSFPSLVNCCAIDWFDEWPKEALLSVAERFFEFTDLGSDEMKKNISTACVEIHASVGEFAVKFYEELRRRYYTTPTSYLELINTYTSMLQEKRKELCGARDKLRTGLQKLADANDFVARMEVELEKLGPELKLKSIEQEQLTNQIAQEQMTADAVKRVVSEEEQVVKEQAQQTEVIAIEAKKDLDEALPILEAAYKALDSLDKKDITEMRGFSKPPELVVTVMEAICVLFKVKPDWDNSKKLLADAAFLKKLTEFDKENIPETVLKKLKRYTEMPNFTPEAVEKVSKAAKSICMWVRAIDLYSQVYKDVLPKRKRLEDAHKTLEETKKKLVEKQKTLRDLEQQLETLRKNFDNSVREKIQLTEHIELTGIRLVRARVLKVALQDEESRWKSSVEKLTSLIDNLVGNVFIAASCCAYFGAFTVKFRAEIMTKWKSICSQLGITVSSSFNLVDFLADPAQVREWSIQGLPSDSLSLENGIFITRGRRWPLIIDPQGEANRWIRKMEGNQLKVIKMNDPKFLRSLENSVRVGQAVLLEDVGESLDPALEPLLLKQVQRQGGRFLIKLGDTLVDYDKNFKMYMTTKLSNPHFLPETCIKATVINFTVTPLGLEGQLLSDVVKLERRELEEQRDSLIVNISADKKSLKDVEEKILRILYNSQGNILDDEVLIQTLDQSKTTAAAISDRVKLAEDTEIMIDAARNKYRPVAARGSLLYFILADLASIDPMYQFSLRYFKNLFTIAIQKTDPNPGLEQHVLDLSHNITSLVYSNVSRGLFERHKLVFSALICTGIMRHSGLISVAEWNFLLRGPSSLITVENRPKPNVWWLAEKAWKNVLALSQSLPVFGSITPKIQEKTEDWQGFMRTEDPFVFDFPESADYTDFQKLLLIKALREEKFLLALYGFISRNLGSSFVEVPVYDLGKVFQSTSASIPVVFVLSPGSDPTTSLMKFAYEKNMSDRLHIVSLGQGQGPIAEELFRRSISNGDWVFLQNCHLASTWISKLELIVKDIQSAVENEGTILDSTSNIGLRGKVNPNFRLFLSSAPSKLFPGSILQDAIKITNEPPRGIRASLNRVFNEMKHDTYDSNGGIYKKLAFGLCFFNAILHERKKFGPLGWNISYDWSQTDLDVSLTFLRRIVVDNLDADRADHKQKIPWDSLTYMTGQIAFGGRVTDEWDRRCLMNILSRFYTPEILNEGYKFSSNGLYFAPSMEFDLAQVKSYIDKLPLDEDPSIFGMHENANISYHIQETAMIVKTMLDVQPRIVDQSDGTSAEQIVTATATRILDDLPVPFDVDITSESFKNPVHNELFQLDSSGRVVNALSIVLLQEIARFNKLLSTIRHSCESLLKAIRGQIIMSADLEKVFTSLLNNEVPKVWADVAYPSLKPLGSWIRDFHNRTQFVRQWLDQGQPKTFWLSGLFFPQGFLTGVLQNYSRAHNVPIDTLTFSYEVLKFAEEGPELDQYLAENRVPGSVIVRGLFMEGARWDRDLCLIQESHPLEIYSAMPFIRFSPRVNTQPPQDQTMQYACPLYKTAVRAGTLSSTGLSTNFVISVHLPTDLMAQHWIHRGVALLCSLKE